MYLCLSVVNLSFPLSLSSILSPLLSVLFYSSLSFPLLSFLVSLFLFSSLSPLFDLVFSLSSPLLPCFPSPIYPFLSLSFPLSPLFYILFSLSSPLLSFPVLLSPLLFVNDASLYRTLYASNTTTHYSENDV